MMLTADHSAPFTMDQAGHLLDVLRCCVLAVALLATYPGCPHKTRRPADLPGLTFDPFGLFRQSVTDSTTAPSHQRQLTMNSNQRTRALTEAAQGLEKEGFVEAAAHLNGKAIAAYTEAVQQGTHDEAAGYAIARQQALGFLTSLRDALSPELCQRLQRRARAEIIAFGTPEAVRGRAAEILASSAEALEVFTVMGCVMGLFDDVDPDDFTDELLQSTQPAKEV